jgi:hypothetical protein
METWRYSRFHESEDVTFAITALSLPPGVILTSFAITALSLPPGVILTSFAITALSLTPTASWSDPYELRYNHTVTDSHCLLE